VIGRVVYDGADRHLKVFRDDGALIYVARCRNDSVSPIAWRSWAGCPPGEYTIGAPEANTTPQDQTEMGPWFVPVYGIPDHVGIGIHGGGSCAGDHAMDPHQGWCPTENCFREQNADLDVFVDLLQKENVFPIKFTVVQPDEEPAESEEFL